MGKVNLGKTRKRLQEAKSNDSFKLEEGKTTVAVLGPCNEDDDEELTAGLPFLSFLAHHVKIDEKRSMPICLDNSDNPLIDHPLVVKWLNKNGTKIKKKNGKSICPVCEAIASGELTELEAKDWVQKEKFLWAVIPISKKTKGAKETTKLSLQAVPFMTSQTIHLGFMEQFEEEGDITDPDGSIYVRLSRDGTGLSTKYKVDINRATLKKPKKYTKEMRNIVNKAQESGKVCDLFSQFANMIRSTDEVEALLAGVKIDNSGDDDDDGKKACFGEDYSEDEECSDCEDKEECMKECGVEEEKPKKKKSKKKVEEEPEEDDDDVEDEDDDGDIEGTEGSDDDDEEMDDDESDSDESEDDTDESDEDEPEDGDDDSDEDDDDSSDEGDDEDDDGDDEESDSDDEDDDEDDDDDEGCYGKEFDLEDTGCTKDCAYAKDCAEACGVEFEPKKKEKKKGKKSAKKGQKKEKPAKKTKVKEEDDSDEDDGLAELEAQLEEMSSEGGTKKKKSKGKK